jgi:hypothetical protein
MRRQTRGEFMGFHGVLVDITGDAAYDDDGYAITAASLGLRAFVGAFSVSEWHESTFENVYPTHIRFSANKQTMYVQALESTAATNPLADSGADNLSTYTCRIFAFGN